MKKTILGLIVIGLTTVITSCESDKEICTTQAYVISVSGKTVNKAVMNNLSLTGDMYLYEDTYISGNLQLNGYTLSVEGYLNVDGNLIGNGSLVCDNDIIVDGNVILNGGSVSSLQGSIISNGNLIGGGDINYCNELLVNGNIENNPTITQVCDDILTIEDPEWIKQIVPCDYIGKTINGKYYQAVK